MVYDSPTVSFFGGVYGLASEFIDEIDSHFWKGFWFLVFLAMAIAILGTIIWSSIFVSKWIGIGLVALFVILDIISYIGSLLE